MIRCAESEQFQTDESVIFVDVSFQFKEDICVMNAKKMTFNSVINLTVCISVFILCVNSVTSKNHSVAVFFNSAKFCQHHLNLSLVKTSLERIPPILKTNKTFHFVYIDLNSSFCDIKEFLSWLRSRDFSLVVLMEECSCEKKFSQFLALLGIKFVSRCDQSVLTVKGLLVLLERTARNRLNFLGVASTAQGLHFYERLSSYLQQTKLVKIHYTFWLTREYDHTNDKLRKAFYRHKNDLSNNKTAGFNFILALEPNDFQCSDILNAARKELNEDFDKILWIFPRVNNHLQMNSLFSNEEDAQVLVAHDSSIPFHCETCVCVSDALRTVTQRTFNVMKGCWEEYVNLNDCLEVGASLESSIGQNLGVPEVNMLGEKCSIDILKMRPNELFGEITWQKVAIWNGKRETLQLYACSKTAIIDNQTSPVFRVPLVEYDPFVIKHEFKDSHPECSYRSKICYELKANTTVIDYNKQFCCTGLAIDVLVYLEEKMPYSFELYFQEEKLYGVYDKDNDSWNGIVDDILTGKADLAVDLFLTPQRCRYLHCSNGYLFSGLNAITKKIKKKTSKKDSFTSLVGNFEVFLGPFDTDLLITVYMVFNILLFLIWGADKITLYYRNKRFRRNEKFTLLESMSYVWATAFGRDVGDSKKPRTLTARFIASWLAFLSLIFINVYVAKLMAKILEEKVQLPFTSLKEPKVLNGELAIGTITGSAMEAYFIETRDHDPLLNKSFQSIRKHLLPTLEAGLQAVEKGTLDGFIADSLSLLKHIQDDYNCSLSLIGKDFNMEPIGFIFRRDWPWSYEFEILELAMNEQNVSMNFWENHFRPRSCMPGTYSGLSIADMSDLFMILACAVAYCALVLIVHNSVLFLMSRCWRSSATWSVPGAGIDENVPRNEVDELGTETNENG